MPPCPPRSPVSFSFLPILLLGSTASALVLPLPLRQAIHTTLKTVEDLVLPSARPDANLKGIFQPVKPTSTGVACKVEGTIPEACYGIFCRNGPNACQPIRYDFFIFDGDGMIHSVQMEKGNLATYSSAYIDTHRLQDEQALGGAGHAKVGDLKYGLASLLHLTFTALRQSVGVLGICASLANTSLLWHTASGTLIAMHEMGAPYVVDIQNGRLATLGRTKFGGEFTGDSTEPFTAHPKIDPGSDILYAFGYSFFEPYLKFYRIRNSCQETLKVLNIPLPRPVMMHDFAITQTHAVFLDNPLIFDVQKTATLGELPFQFEPQHGSRVGVIPLDATSPDQIQWFELPQSTFVFHTMNAWNEQVDEEGKPTKIEVVVAQYDDMQPFGDLGVKPNPYRVRLWKYGMDLTSGELYFNDEIADTTDRYNVEFPLVPPQLVGRKSRYGYMAVNDRENSDQLTGFIKVDLEQRDPAKAVVGRVFYGPDTTGGEGQFVPSIRRRAREDDGYFMVFTNTKQGDGSLRSELRIYNTKTMSPKPVAAIKIPSLVPFGFHGTFIPEKSLQDYDRSSNLAVERYSTAMLVKDEGYRWGQ